MVPTALGRYDKVVHFTMYAVLAGLLTVSFRVKWPLLRSLVVAITIVAAFGAVDEWHQRFIPGRTTDVVDWVADTIGGASGMLAATLLVPRWLKRSRA